MNCLFVRQSRRFLLPFGEFVRERFSTMHGGLSMRIAALLGIIVGLFTFAPASFAGTKKVVFLAGKKSHGPGDHEYEKACRLLAHCLETSSNARGFKTEVHLYGWPEDVKTLDDADCIVVYSAGADHNETDHPMLVGDRMKVIERQLKLVCVLVLLYYCT